MIGLYIPSVASYLAYDNAAPKVAALLAKNVTDASSGVSVEHIGSTAVPQCAGRGIIDLLVLYKSGTANETRNALDRLGFQRQGGLEPSPEAPSLYVGTVEHLGRTYSVHAHVIEAGSAEALALIKFRDLLRNSVGLRLAYEMEKRGILVRGNRTSAEYLKAKSDFIRHVLNADQF